MGAQAQEVPAAREERQVQEAIGGKKDGEDAGEGEEFKRKAERVI